MADKVKYTEEMEAKLREVYEANPTRETVEALCAELNKPYRSVVSKLTKMGIYQTPVRVTKSGEPIVKKEELVDKICMVLGVDAPSLIKTNKRDLKLIVEAILEMEYGSDNTND